jgi:hypothetical protein
VIEQSRLTRDTTLEDLGRIIRACQEHSVAIATPERTYYPNDLDDFAIEQGSRGRCCDCASSQDRAKHQTGGGRREAAELVQVDDLEREDQPIAEPAERIPGLQEQHHARHVRPPSSCKKM